MDTQIRRQLKWLVMATAVMGMGIAMPSCPGQQAMQQQIDSLQSSQAELIKKLQTLEAQNKATAQKVQTLEDFAKQVGETIGAQKAAMDSMGLAIKELQARPQYVPPAPKAKKPVPHKKGR